MNAREPETRKIVPLPEKKNEAITKRPNGVQRLPYNGLYPFHGYRVTVHHLAPSVTWRDLKDFLRMAGEVRFANVIQTGVGIGEFGTPQERANVIRMLNGKELKGKKVYIKQLNEMDPRFQGTRPFGHYAPPFFSEPIPFGPVPAPPYEAPYGPGFDPYPYNNGGPVIGPMEYPHIAFGPPPRIPPWGGAARGGRGFPPFLPPYVPGHPNFPRPVRPDMNMNAWGFPPVPPRPVLHGRVVERPPPPVYSQPMPPLRPVDFGEQHEEHLYPPAPGAPTVFPDALPDGHPYESCTPAGRDFHGYVGRYRQIEGREKAISDYNGNTEEWNRYLARRREREAETGHYPQYDGSAPVDASEPPIRPYAPYPRSEDPRVEFHDYVPSRSFSDERRKDYRTSGYGNLESVSPKKSEPVCSSYEYPKSRVSSDEYTYRIGDCRSSKEGYTSNELYSKDHRRSEDYEYSRTEPRGYEYKQRETSYYGRRGVEPEGSYRGDDDPRGVGGVERSRQRTTHRTAPYDR